MPRRVQKAPRKRTGCATCKSAHVRCTEEKPRCRRCQRLLHVCEYEFRLLWEEDALQRNIVHGRVGVWTRDGRKIDRVSNISNFLNDKEELVWVPIPTKADWHFTNFTPEDFCEGLPLELQDETLPEEATKTDVETVQPTSGAFEKTDIVEGIFDRAPPGIIESNSREPADEGMLTSVNALEHLSLIDWTFDINPLPLNLSPLTVLPFSSTDSQLLDYYIHELSPKCSLTVDSNPYLDVLLPVAYEYEPLRHTLLAASACQLYHFSGDRQYEVYSLRHRSKAIRGLNKHLNTGDMDWKSLATMVMFCFRDITDGCEPSWITHLKMGLRMLKELLCTTKVDRELRKFCEIYFVAHDVMGRTAWEEGATQLEHYQWDQDESYREIDSIMGCSPELISIISQISYLAGLKNQYNDQAGHAAATAAELMSQLFELHQVLRTGAGHVESMLQISEVKRLSAMLYLHDRVMSPHYASTTLSRSLRSGIIEAIKQLPASSGASLWPLFILGKSNLSDHEQARFVLDRFHQLEQSRYLGSFHHARRRVEKNILRRLTAHGDVLQQTWEDDSALNENERWVSLA